ncbi:acetyl-CoA C-acyltransferase [Halobacteriales archaeon QS_1_68_20]|nr:MAG: acetyl-CoA C-acyltransferase [Halobacteriales archaeon QS_1_68_20]
MSKETTPVIAKAYRTPQGKQDGVFSEVRSEDLSIPLINEILAATGLDSGHVDDLMWGVAQQRGEQDNNVARIISILSDLGEEVPGTTINRWCASSMQAVMSASDAVRAGQRDCLVVGGVESMTRVPMEGAYEGRNFHPRLQEEYNLADLQMGMTAEKVAEEYDVGRDEQDEYGYRSHMRAAEATERGRFEDQIVPVEGTDDEGNSITVTQDEGIRPNTTVEKMGQLPTVFKADGTVTPGNSSQISDGAAALLVTSEAFAEDYGLDVMAYVGDHNVAGVDPTVMGIGPVPATKGLLERTGESIDEFDLVELNEAFASQTLYAQRELGVPDEKFNVNGGAIAIGHPLGASGARLPVTLIHELNHRSLDKGLATLCVGFGQGGAITFTR